MSSRSGLDALPGSGALREAGKLFQLTVDIVKAVFQRPFQMREFIQQAWFVASVTILPTAPGRPKCSTPTCTRFTIRMARSIAGYWLT